MQLDVQTATASPKVIWAGRILSAIPVLMLVLSGVTKLVKPPAVVEGFTQLGYPESLALGIGITELACTALYVFPRTSVLGAILLTGYLGGATATPFARRRAIFRADYPRRGGLAGASAARPAAAATGALARLGRGKLQGWAA